MGQGIQRGDDRGLTTVLFLVFGVELIVKGLPPLTA